MMSSGLSRFALLALSLICGFVVAGEAQKLRVGYYDYTCPRAEAIIQRAVFKAVSVNPGLAAGVIRIHFHDCFVRGCDASILLDPVRGKPQVEKLSVINFPSLQGIEVIDAAKAQLEKVCPGIVSCADIIAFAARDSSLKTGWIWYPVPSGRKDGRVSLSSEVLPNVPPPSFNATQLRDNFKRKGLSLDEMVTLSGAHCIGVSHCSAFSSRLRNFSATSSQDPSLDKSYGSLLRTLCPASGSADPPVNNDILTPNLLDKYYVNLKYKKGLLTSDQTLFDSKLTRKMVLNNAKDGSVWAKKFAAAMVHMGSIEVLTGGNQGEVRRNCRFVN